MNVAHIILITLSGVILGYAFVFVKLRHDKKKRGPLYPNYYPLPNLTPATMAGTKIPQPTSGKLQAFAGRNWYPLDPDLVAKYKKDKRVSNIKVYQTGNHSTDGGSLVSYPKIQELNDFVFYFDSTHYFNLVIQNKTVACIGFRVTTKTGVASNLGRVVVVEQIQGRGNSKTELSKVKWERLLIAVLITWARENNMVEVRVMNADQQAYWPHKHNELETIEANITKYEQNLLHSHPIYGADYWEKLVAAQHKQMKILQEKMHRFKMHYDVTPKRMGFKQVKGTHYQSLEL